MSIASSPVFLFQELFYFNPLLNPIFSDSLNPSAIRLPGLPFVWDCKGRKIYFTAKIILKYFFSATQSFSFHPHLSPKQGCKDNYLILPQHTSTPLFIEPQPKTMIYKEKIYESIFIQPTTNITHQSHTSPINLYIRPRCLL